MKKNFIFKIVLACLFLCISLNARTQTTASLPSSFTETSAPTGEVRFPAEFEPVQAVVIAHYQEGRNLPARLIKQMAQEVKVITLVNTDEFFTTEQVRDLYASELTEEELANCEFIEAPLNGRWTRDFTPWIIFNGTEPAIVENIYNRCYVFIDNNNNKVSYITDPNNDSRAKLYDDAIPQYFKEYFKDENGNTISLPMYGMKVVHTGGNMMQDGRGVGVSDLIVHTESEEFLGQTYDETNQKMKDYLGIDPYHVTIDPQGDYIAHVDCWGKFLAPDKILIAAVPSTNDQYDEYEEVANYFATTNCCWGYPYKVYRVSVPDRNDNTNIAAPYTNSLILNKKVFVPLDADTESKYNEAALQVYRDAMPGYTIIGVEYNYNDEFLLENDWAWDGWHNTDALHCRTHEIMDFNMLFVDHRNVLFGEQTYQESYPITAKFIAYSGNNITSTQLHYSINDGAYQTVEMTATGNADEYTANITGHNNGDVIKYYVTGEDASGKTCVQPQFGELEPHTFTAGEASGQPTKTVLNTTKYYRIKTASGTGYQYLTIFDHTSNPLGTYGGVGVAMLDEDNAGQMFKLEDAGEGKYYLISADGYYIYCQSNNVDAIDGTQKSTLWGFDSENGFELQCDNGYFKVENVSGNNYVFCNASNETRATTIATWTLEEVPLSVTISANSTSVTVNEIVQLNATAIGGTGNYTYSWSPATSFANATIANPTFTSATASDYTFTCTVTDNGESVTSNTVTITVNEAGTGGGTGSDVVTIGDVTASTTSSMIPIYTYYSKSISQSYYLKDEIGKDKGTISSIAFHTATGDFPCERTISIYMKNTDASSFADKNMIAMENGDLVFNGPVVFASNQWVTIDLGTDFSYNGNNILLCVYDETGSYIDYADFKTFADNSDTRTRYQYGNASSDFSPIGKQISGRTSIYAVPIIQLTFGDGTTQEPDPITISANPSKVIVGDEINFTVMQGSANVTANTKFYIGDTEITNPYTTTSAGTFTVRAEKDGLTSETTFTVVEPNPIVLYVTPSEAIVGQNIKFIVTQVDINGTEQDVTNDSRFYIVETDTEVLSTYTTETAGTFTVRAEKDGLTTTATFTVVEPIVLTATPSNVTVGDEINFTVMQGSIDVTANSKFYIGTNEISNPYTTTDAGKFTVCAEKDYLNAETTIIVNEAQQGGDDTSGDVVTIDGDAAYSKYVPICSGYKYSISQQYYLKDEIGRDNGTITEIAFQTDGDASYPYDRTIEVYMINTESAKFNSENTIALQSTDKVFSGTISFNQGDTWFTMALTSPFTYTGNNILVCVNDITGSSRSESELYFKTFANNNSRCLYQTNSSVVFDPTKSYETKTYPNKVPFIQLTFGDAGTTPDQPVNPTISVDKTRIEADGTDYATFTVTPADAEIYWYKGTETATKLNGNKFNTSIHGTYSFYAKKDELVSETITVEAVANDLTITPSVNTILANGIEEVTFTVTQVDVNGKTQDVTNKCTFKINGTAITGNTFFTNRAGTYTVTATKNSKEASTQITATAVSGEENVVVIDGNVMQPADQSDNYNDDYKKLSVPVNNYDNYGISQQYYRATEIGKDEGIITHIAFKTAKTAGEAYIRNIEIYMVNTDESDFGTSHTMKTMSDTDLVFSGKVSFAPNSWIKIPLNTSFKYVNGKNILVCVNDKTGSKNNELTSHFDAYAKGYTDNTRTLYNNHNETAFNPTSEIADAKWITFTPFVKFTFEQELPIVLEGSKQTIKADGGDIIRFTVTQGVNNVTDKTEIYVEQYEGTTTINTTVLNAITGYSFTTTNAGNYRVYAKKGDLTSTYVEFTAIQPIILTVDKTSIIADGSDAATFTLMQNGVDVTTAEGTVIYVGDEVITNTFTTTIMGTYIAYATRDGIRSNGIEITVNDKNYEGSEGVEGGSENEYYNGDGSITYNKGQDNEYTLIAKKINNTTAYIKQDNVKVNATGDYYWRYDQNKPQAATILTIPEKILFGDEWITITKIEDFAFSDKCDISEDGRNCFEPGNPLNSNFTGVIIPSTITEIGTYTFGFTIEEYVICFAKTPPALSKTTVNNPFYKNTYDNVILYVPAESIDDYRNALGWGTPFMGGDEYYFKNIYPITMPTYVEIEKDDLSWDNADNWRTYVKIDEDNYEERYGVMPSEGEDVLIDGNVRITEECVANVGAIHIISGSITIADGGQLIHTNAGVNVTLEKNIIGYGESTDPTSWYTISSPLFSSIKASSVVNLLENEYDLYRYDEPTHYWDNIEDPEGEGGGPVGYWETLDAGRGYLYANQEDVTLQFKGIANHIGGSYTLTRDVWDGVLIGFHLVGNPFTHDIYMNNAFNTDATLADGYYVLSSTGAWSAKLGSDETIKPCQGVLINASTEGTLTINKKVGPAVAQTQTRSRANNEFLTISVANKNYEDVTYVSFDAITPLEKVNHQNKDIPMVYIPMEEAIYAIAAMEDDVKEIPVAFEAKTMGQYTISVKSENCEFESMYLVDRKTGVETDLLLEDYTFLATTTDNSERFTIRLNDNNSDNEDFIFINNGEIIINKIEGKGVLQIFDVMGRYISHSEVSGSANISTEAFTSGVYIIRMTDDNGIKTQKVVL